jgi:hypothetical protein
MAPSAFAAAQWPCPLPRVTDHRPAIGREPDASKKEARHRTESGSLSFHASEKRKGACHSGVASHSIPMLKSCPIHSPVIPSPPVSSSSVADGWAYEPPVRPYPTRRRRRARKLPPSSRAPPPRRRVKASFPKSYALTHQILLERITHGPHDLFGAPSWRNRNAGYKTSAPSRLRAGDHTGLRKQIHRPVSCLVPEAESLCLISRLFHPAPARSIYRSFRRPRDRHHAA